MGVRVAPAGVSRGAGGQLLLLAMLLLLSPPLRGEAPAGWRLRGAEAGLAECEVAADTGTVRQGRASARMTCAGSVHGSRSLNQSIRADEYRGRRLRLSGWIKPLEVEARALLWMRVDSADAVLAFANHFRRPVRGTGDWQMRELVLDVPRDAMLITFGLLLHDHGTVWMDDLKLESVGTEVPARNLLAAPKPWSRERRERHAQRYADSPNQPVNLDFER